MVGPRGGNLGLYGVVGLGIGMREHLQKLRKNVAFMPVWPFYYVHTAFGLKLKLGPSRDFWMRCIVCLM